jgi:hypothetical protein
MSPYHWHSKWTHVIQLNIVIQLQMPVGPIMLKVTNVMVTTPKFEKNFTSFCNISVQMLQLLA